MKVGFYTVFRHDPIHYTLAARLLASIRKHMPGAEVWHFTDETSPIVLGVDEARRLPHGKMLERRLEHYALCEGDWLLLDTDVILKRDVSDVFEHHFDVALADRNWPHKTPTQEYLLSMPFNTGVCFSRYPGFWADTLTAWRALPEQDWLSEQRAVYQVVRTGAFRVRILDGMVYNYPPKAEDDPCEGAAIVHYKGNRKGWMAA